jgi:proline dehydrogenase
VDKETERRLRRLAIKWVSQARHPMRVNRPEERALLVKCAAELQQEIHDERSRVTGPHRSCCETRPGESHLGTCDKSVMNTGKWNE